MAKVRASELQMDFTGSQLEQSCNMVQKSTVISRLSGLTKNLKLLHEFDFEVKKVNKKIFNMLLGGNLILSKEYAK